MKGHVGYPSNDDFENYAFVMKPTLYMPFEIYKNISMQIGLGFEMKHLRDESYSFTYSDGEPRRRDFHPGFGNTFRLSWDFLFFIKEASA